MITHRHPSDYRKTYRTSAEIRAKEQAIIDWISNLVKWFNRGLITTAEFDRLAAEGPEAK